MYHKLCAKLASLALQGDVPDEAKAYGQVFVYCRPNVVLIIGPQRSCIRLGTHEAERCTKGHRRTSQT